MAWGWEAMVRGKSFVTEPAFERVQDWCGAPKLISGHCLTWRLGWVEDWCMATKLMLFLFEFYFCINFIFVWILFLFEIYLCLNSMHFVWILILIEFYFCLKSIFFYYLYLTVCKWVIFKMFAQYLTCAIKGRSFYSKNIFQVLIGAANIQERFWWRR